MYEAIGLVAGHQLFVSSTWQSVISSARVRRPNRASPFGSRGRIDSGVASPPLALIDASTATSGGAWRCRALDT
jgi:hypothetical protein